MKCGHNKAFIYWLVINSLWKLVKVESATKNVAVKSLPITNARLASTLSPQVLETTHLNKQETGKSINLKQNLPHFYGLSNDLKLDSPSLPYYPLNMPVYAPFLPYSNTPRANQFYPFFSFPQTIWLTTYPFAMSPELLYSNGNEHTATDSNENMSRARCHTKCSHNQRNSPIFYVPLIATPYMFLQHFPPFMPYAALTNMATMSSVVNLPLNLQANGKPSGIYGIDDSANDLSHKQYTSASSLPTPNNFLHQGKPQSYGMGTKLSSTPTTFTETTATSSVGPYAFNGRPEDIFILPNNINSVYDDGAYYAN